MKRQSFDVDMDDESKARCLTLRSLFQEVYKVLGKGYPEGVYQRGIAVELQNKNIPFDLEVTMSIPYKGHVVGQVRADVILRNDLPVVIETKATASALKPEERWQLSRYMKILDIPLGVLINFPQVSTANDIQIDFLVSIDDMIYSINIDTNEVTELS
jgi:GxxExxY protein